MGKVVLKVNVKATQCGCRFENSNTGEVLGSAYKDPQKIGRYCGLAFHATKYGEILCGATYTDAVEFVSDKIESVLALVGIDVEFVNLEGEK